MGRLWSVGLAYIKKMVKARGQGSKGARFQASTPREAVGAERKNMMG